MTDGLAPVPLGSTAPEEVHRCLGRLAALPGVALAALVDAEGFVLASVGTPPGDPAGPAAVSSWLVEALDATRELLGLGALRAVLLEHGDGAMMVNPLRSGGLLALVGSDPGALGEARRRIDEALPILGRGL